MDNYIWDRDAEKNQLVVGTQARILYQDAVEGRLRIALKFNEMVRKGEVGPIMLDATNYRCEWYDLHSARPPISKTVAT